VWCHSVAWIMLQTIFQICRNFHAVGYLLTKWIDSLII
jgi:hypothetical protein